MNSKDTETVNGRSVLLLDINKRLTELGLKPIRKLGDASKGEIEIVGLKEVYDHSKRFFSDVKFAVKFPNGNPGEFTVRFNANGATSDGAVIFAVVNGRIAIVKQWRVTLGMWTYEIPRGFGDKVDQARIAGQVGTLKIGDLPLGTLARELGEEVMKDAEISTITHLGNAPENSGTHAVAPSYFVVRIDVPERLLQQKLKGSDDEIGSVMLWTRDRLKAEIGHKVCDNHSIVAYALAMKFFDSMSLA